MKGQLQSSAAALLCTALTRMESAALTIMHPVCSKCEMPLCCSPQRCCCCRLLVASRVARLCGVAYMLALHTFLALLVYFAIDGQGPWEATELLVAAAEAQQGSIGDAGTSRRLI